MKVMRFLRENAACLVLAFLIWCFLIAFDVLIPVKEIKINSEIILHNPFEISRWWDVALFYLFWLIPLLVMEKSKELEKADPCFDFGILVGLIGAVVFLFLFYTGHSLVVALLAPLFTAFILDLLSKIVGEGVSTTLKFNLGFSVIFGIGPGICLGFVWAPLFFAGAWVACFLGIVLGYLYRFAALLKYRIHYGKEWKVYMPIIWRL